MNYHNITHDDMLNGTGLREVLWVAGCSHHCKECQNPQTHSLTSGIPFDDNAMNELLEGLKPDYIEGLTLSGGDPLHIKNREQVTEIAKTVKEKFPDKNIWLYSGYTFDEVKDLEIMKYIDVMVDGKFVIKLKDDKLHWKGSSNQNIIDVQQSLKTNQLTILNS